MARKYLEVDVKLARMNVNQLQSLQVPEVADPTQYGLKELQADLRAVGEQLLTAFPQLMEVVSQRNVF